MEQSAWTVVEIVLCFVIIIFHTIGCYCLICVIREENGTAQHILILNASITEVIGTLMYLLYVFLTNVSNDTIIPHPSLVRTHVEIIIYVFFTLIYILNLLVVITDRLLYVLLGIRYCTYWNQQRTKMLLIFIWSIGVVFTASVSLCLHLRNGPHEVAEQFFTYFYILLDFSFLILTTISYSIMFHLFKRTRSSPVQSYNNQMNNNERRTSFEIFINSRFRVSALLVLNFFFLVVIPDFVLLIHHLLSIDEGMILNNIVWTLFLMSHISDAIIYMFTQPEVKKTLRTKLNSLSYVLPELSQRRRHVVDGSNDINETEMISTDSSTTSPPQE